MQLYFKNKTLSLTSPIIMGILNVTPDSFFDGGRFTNKKSILFQTEKMLNEGADIIDVGGCSTRPGVQSVSEKTELKRLIPAIKIIRKKFHDIIISADTFRSIVAKKSIDAGADMINDISGGGIDNNMFNVVANSNVPYILMHIKGIPQTMEQDPYYKNIVEEVKKYFTKKIILLKKSGVKQIIIDPGFGFGKTPEHNYSLLNNLCSFKPLELPLLVGISRKSMINKILDVKPKEALNGTTVVNTMALLNGANILRVHDVKEAKEAIKIYEQVQNS